MIATMGGRFGGYGLYLLKGKPVFVYNLLNLKALPLGRRRRRRRLARGVAQARQAHDRVRFQVDGPGFGKGGTGVLSVDGKELSARRSSTRFRS
jgi:arylsulfatase